MNTPILTITPDTELVTMACNGTDEDLISSFLGNMSAQEYLETQAEAINHGNPCAAIIEMCEQYMHDGSVWIEGDEPDEELPVPPYLSAETFTPRQVHEAILAQAQTE